MSVEAHLEQLTTKHAELEREISTEMQSPLPDTLRITQLKRQKLQLKDRISVLSDADAFST